MPEHTISDFLSPELAARITAADSETESHEKIFALTGDALEEVSLLYRATTQAKEMTGSAEYDQMLGALQQAILAGTVAWASARKFMREVSNAST